MQPVVFSAAWFARWQHVLLGLLACPLLGRWFRWVLCIRRGDVGYRGRIVQVLPHAYVVANPDGSCTLDCRTHAKYAKRLYHAFWPIWRGLHAWDLAIANRLCPALNLGFDTLTVYPDPAPETTTVDGDVGRASVDETFATIIAGAGTTFQDEVSNSMAAENAASGTTNQFSAIRRGIYLFDTSALGSADISSATLSLWGNGVQNNLGEAPLHIVGSTPASNTALANSDYGQVQKTSFGSIPFASWTTSGYNDVTLNASGRSNISKSGVSKFGSMTEWDQTNTFGGTWIAFGQLYFQIDFAETGGTANDPKLVVTYTPQARNRVAFDQQVVFAPDFTNGASTSAALGGAVVEGQLLTLVGLLGSSVATVSTVTDSLSNTWQLARRQRGSSANSSYACEIWYAANSAAGTPTVTATMTSTAAGRMQFGLHSWTNASSISTACLVQVGSTQAVSSLVGTGGGLANLTSGSLVVVTYKTRAGVTNRSNPAGFSTLAPQNSTRENTFYQIQTSSGAVDPIWQVTTSTQWAGAIAEFYGSTFTPVAGSFHPNTLPLLGVQ